jgi:hypothetical protein
MPTTMLDVQETLSKLTVQDKILLLSGSGKSSGLPFPRLSRIPLILLACV